MGTNRHVENSRGNGRGERTEQNDVRAIHENERRNRSVIDFDQLEVDAVQYLNITDLEYLYSLSIREWNNLMKGATLRDIKNYEEQATQAIFIARAQNEKRVNAKKLFDGEKVRKKLDKPNEQKKDFTRFDRAQKAMKSFSLSPSR